MSRGISRLQSEDYALPRGSPQSTYRSAECDPRSISKQCGASDARPSSCPHPRTTGEVVTMNFDRGHTTREPHSRVNTGPRSVMLTFEVANATRASKFHVLCHSDPPFVVLAHTKVLAELETVFDTHKSLIYARPITVQQRATHISLERASRCPHIGSVVVGKAADDDLAGPATGDALTDSRRQQHVVVIKKTDHATVAVAKTRVAGASGAAILGYADYPYSRVRMRRNWWRTPVVDDHAFDVGIGLVQRRPDRL